MDFWVGTFVYSDKVSPIRSYLVGVLYLTECYNMLQLWHELLQYAFFAWLPLSDVYNYVVVVESYNS